jgi:hypothetical protein
MIPIMHRETPIPRGYIPYLTARAQTTIVSTDILSLMGQFAMSTIPARDAMLVTNEMLNIMEDISVVKFDLISPQDIQVFFSESLFCMMLFLVLDISDHIRKITFRV